MTGVTITVKSQEKIIFFFFYQQINDSKKRNWRNIKKYYAEKYSWYLHNRTYCSLPLMSILFKLINIFRPHEMPREDDYCKGFHFFDVWCKQK